VSTPATRLSCSGNVVDYKVSELAAIGIEVQLPDAFLMELSRQDPGRQRRRFPATEALAHLKATPKSCSPAWHSTVAALSRNCPTSAENSVNVWTQLPPSHYSTKLWCGSFHDAILRILGHPPVRSHVESRHLHSRRNATMPADSASLPPFVVEPVAGFRTYGGALSRQQRASARLLWSGKTFILSAMAPARQDPQPVLCDVVLSVPHGPAAARRLQSGIRLGTAPPFPGCSQQRCTRRAGFSHWPAGLSERLVARRGLSQRLSSSRGLQGVTRRRRHRPKLRGKSVCARIRICRKKNSDCGRHATSSPQGSPLDRQVWCTPPRFRASRAYCDKSDRRPSPTC
jgi:hypothetical protein